MSEMPPPPDYTQMEPPPDIDELAYVPDPVPFTAVTDDAVPSAPTTAIDDRMASETPELAEEWHWQDARLIGVDRGVESTNGRYEIGGIDVYADPQNGDLAASYLPIAAFDNIEAAEDLYHDLQAELHTSDTPIHRLAAFAEAHAFAQQPEPANWRSAGAAEYAAYEYIQQAETQAPDLPPDAALDTLLDTARELGGKVRAIEPTPEQQALTAIGLDATGFDPATNPPPFYDPDTDTAYWIGIFQADSEDREHCVTSILSLGRDAESEALVAHLAPCVPGDWEKAQQAAAHLAAIAERDGIEPLFDAAEALALATDQRTHWQDERGVPLAADTAQHIAAHTPSEIDL